MADSTEKRKLQIMNVILGLHRINYNFVSLFVPTSSTFPSLQALVASPAGIFHYITFVPDKTARKRTYFILHAIQ